MSNYNDLGDMSFKEYSCIHSIFWGLCIEVYKQYIIYSIFYEGTFLFNQI